MCLLNCVASFLDRVGGLPPCRVQPGDQVILQGLRDLGRQLTGDLFWDQVAGRSDVEKGQRHQTVRLDHVDHFAPPRGNLQFALFSQDRLQVCPGLQKFFPQLRDQGTLWRLPPLLRPSRFDDRDVVAVAVLCVLWPPFCYLPAEQGPFRHAESQGRFLDRSEASGGGSLTD